MSMLFCDGRHLDEQQAINLTDTALPHFKRAVRSSRRLLLGQQTTVRFCRAGVHTLHTISRALDICEFSLEGSGICKSTYRLGMPAKPAGQRWLSSVTMSRPDARLSQNCAGERLSGKRQEKPSRSARGACTAVQPQ